MRPMICIVEGHGEVEALPLLIRRVARERCGVYNLRLLPPIRIQRTKLVHRSGHLTDHVDRELGRVIELAARKVGPKGAVLLLLDAETDCPAELGPNLASRARSVRPDVLISVALAKHEFESWFIASGESLGLNPGGIDPESIRDAKGWLKAQLGRYKETVDQEKLTARLNFEEAVSCPSFSRCLARIEQLVRAMTQDTD